MRLASIIPFIAVGAFAAEQGKPADIGGYYLPKPELLKKWLRPVAEFNAVIDAL